MSTENNLNIADILNEIKDMSEEKINQIKNSWHGISKDRILIYKEVISALESNSRQMFSGFFRLFANIRASNAVVVYLDVKIIMSFVDKILGKVSDTISNFQLEIMVYRLFATFGEATLKLWQSKTKMIPQDLSAVISLAGKVLKCIDVTRTNDSVIVGNLFAAICNFIYMLGENENIETEDVANIISLAQSVVADNGIEWDSVHIYSVLCTLVSLLSSADLNQEQVDNTVRLITKLTDKLKINDPSLVETVFGMLYKLHRVVLFDKHNPSNLQAKQCLDLISNLFKKIYILNPDECEYKEKDQNALQAVTDLITEIVQHYAQNQENIEIIENCGFNINRENGKIKSLDTAKLKEFAGECIAKEVQQVLSLSLSKNPEPENKDKDKNKYENQVNNKENSTKSGKNGNESSTNKLDKQKNENKNHFDNETNSTTSNKGLDTKESKLHEQNKKINSTEKDKFSEMLWHYKSADELLKNEADKGEIAGCLVNVVVTLWDKFKTLPSWLWFMICNWELVSLDIYTKAAKYCSEQQNQIKDVNKNEIGLKDKIQSAVDKNKQLNLKPKFKNDHENTQMLDDQK